jgi:hypothetical protein
MASWMAWDVLTSLHRHQSVVDRLRAFPGWNETPQLRNIVALDVDALCAHLFTVIHTPSQYRALSNLKDHEAQAVLNLMQNVRYNHYPLSVCIEEAVDYLLAFGHPIPRPSFQESLRRRTLKVIRKVRVGSRSIGTRPGHTRRRLCICRRFVWGAIYRVFPWESCCSEGI